MADDHPDIPEPKHDFDDLLGELDAESSFAWDEDLEPEEEDTTRPVVVFRIGGDYFAIASESVREIVSTTASTQLPGAPAHIQGITVVRRQVVGLLSLRTFLELDDEGPQMAADGDEERPPREQDIATERTIIVDTAHFTVGLRVDEVAGLGKWAESKLDPETIPDNMRETTRRYARGVDHRDGRPCAYLDLETLLDDAALR